MTTRQNAATRVAAFVALACLLVVFVTACGSSSKSGSDNNSGGSSAKNFSVTLPNGQASLSLTGALPPLWPSDFPVPPGAKVSGSGSLGGKERTASVAVYSTTMAAKDAFHFYDQNANLKVSDSTSAGLGSAFVGKLTLVSPYKGSLAVVGRGDTTYIVIELDTAGANAAPTTVAAATGATTTTAG